jgi:two-component system cell cycle sensor histidine kinase/response regulator CckA
VRRLTVAFSDRYHEPAFSWFHMSGTPTSNGQAGESVAGLRARISELERRCADEAAERLRIQQALGESEELYRLLVDFSQDFIYWRGPDGRAKYVSPACRELTGYSADEFLGRPTKFEEIVHPEDRALWAAHSELALDGTQSEQIEFRIVTRGGQTRWIAHTCRAVCGAHGEFLGVRASNRDVTRARRAQQELERARLLFIGGPVVVFRWSAREGWPIEYVSPNVASLFGRSPEEFLAGSLCYADVLHPDDLARVTSEVAQHTQAGLTCFEQDYRILRPDGEPRWLSDFTVVRRDEAGRVTHFDGYVMDVTGRKLAERALERRARFLSGLSAAAERLLPSQPEVPYQVFVEALGPASGASRVYVFLNTRGEDGELRASQAAEWCAPGISRQIDNPELRNMPFERLFPDWAKIGMAGGVVNCRAAEAPAAVRPLLEVQGVRSLLLLPLIIDGELAGFIGFDNCVVDRLWEPSEVEFLRAASADLAQAMKRQRVEAALREQEEKYRSMMDAMEELVYICSADLRVEYMNPAMIRRTGRNAVGEPCYRALHNRDEKCPWCPNDLIQQGRSHVWQVTSPKDGRTLHASNTPIFRSDGTISKMAIIRDITAVKQAEEQRRKLEARVQQVQKLESLGVLAGGVAHDFNNLLVAVLGYAGLAQSEIGPHSPAQISLRRIEQAAQRAAELTGQMLAYSGKGHFSVGPVQLSRLVEEMADLLLASVSRKAVLKREFGANLPFIEADATQVRQVIMNLITNASEALGDGGGLIVLRTGVTEVTETDRSGQYLEYDLVPGNYVFLEVTDSGCGMDTETRARIFDPFFTTKFTGRGLGLAAVLGIVRGHRGAITVDSAPRRGTTFRVLFPVTARTVSSEAPEIPQVQKRGENHVILVVDDEEVVRSLAQTALERAGFKVLAAGDGQTAIDVFRERHKEIDAVVLDLTMPRMSGAEVFHELRNIDPAACVVLTSGYNEQDATRHFHDSELAGYIQKPYRAVALVDKVCAAIAGM